MKNTLIDQSFNCWINNYPESFHWCDMERFYSFSKTIFRYGRNLEKYDSNWLRIKIENSKKFAKDENVDYFVNLFEKLKDFHFSKPLKNQKYS